MRLPVRPVNPVAPVRPVKPVAPTDPRKGMSISLQQFLVWTSVLIDTDGKRSTWLRHALTCAPGESSGPGTPSETCGTYRSQKRDVNIAATVLGLDFCAD